MLKLGNFNEQLTPGAFKMQDVEDDDILDEDVLDDEDDDDDDDDQLDDADDEVGGEVDE